LWYIKYFVENPVMKITLIQAPHTLTKFSAACPAVPPVGLAYLAASLIKAQYEVLVIDSVGEALHSYYPLEGDLLYRGLSLAQIVDRCQDGDVFGLSVMFSRDWPIAKTLIRRLKEKFPKALLVIGGEHATADPVGALEDCSELDYAVVGEGDFAFPQLLAAVSAGADLRSVGSICYRASERKIVLNPKLCRNKQMVQIPWPAWDLFPLENYLAEGFGWGVNRGRNMPIIASRGCPYQCTFCSNPNMWESLWTVRTVEDVIREIEFYIQKYKVTNFDFQDLTAIIKKDWIKDFCLELMNRKIRITWQLPTGTRTEAIDEEVARLLFRSGCRNITFAPESGSTEVLLRIKKKINLDRVYRSAQGCVCAKIDVKFNFIFGFPEDTYWHLFESVVFMVKLGFLGVSDVSISAFSPYPGSELFLQLQQKGKIPQKLDDGFYKELSFAADILSNVSWCERIPSKALDRMRTMALVIFYIASWISHPLRPFKRAYNFFNDIEESRLDKSLGDMKRRNKILRENKHA